MQYIVIERLAQGGRAKLKDDGLNLSDWLQCLASFWGHLYVPFDSETVTTFWYPTFFFHQGKAEFHYYKAMKLQEFETVSQ